MFEQFLEFPLSLQAGIVTGPGFVIGMILGEGILWSVDRVCTAVKRLRQKRKDAYTALITAPLWLGIIRMRSQ